jgi:LmbE family N-acetylglucosaminyl deacetylase
VSLIDVDRGTDELTWCGWPAMARWPALDLASWQGRRAVVLSAHPDDEVLALGGTLTLMGRLDIPLIFVWATNGEASHPGSLAPAVDDLARLRRLETRAALARLGIHGTEVWLGLPDGGLAERQLELTGAVRSLHRPGDLWFAPFRGDGHPDHEACGRAAAEVAEDLVEAPIWAWHWATPGDERIPWKRARAVALPEDVMARKEAAIAEFRTQVTAIGPGLADGPVLPERVLDHFRRRFEVVLT